MLKGFPIPSAFLISTICSIQLQRNHDGSWIQCNSIHIPLFRSILVLLLAVPMSISPLMLSTFRKFPSQSKKTCRIPIVGCCLGLRSKIELWSVVIYKNQDNFNLNHRHRGGNEVPLLFLLRLASAVKGEVVLRKTRSEAGRLHLILNRRKQ